MQYLQVSIRILRLLYLKKYMEKSLVQMSNQKNVNSV